MSSQKRSYLVDTPGWGLAPRPHRDYVHGVHSAGEILLFLIGVSFGLFILISLLVMLPGRSAQRRVESGPVWLGGPSRSERGVSTSDLVLADRARWAEVPEHDWVAAAETAEPGGHLGGASAGW